MRNRVIIVAILVLCLFAAIGCSQPKPTTPPTAPTSGDPGNPDVKPGEEPTDKPAETPAQSPEEAKLDPDTAALFKALDKFKPEEDFFYEKEFEALKTRGQELAQKKDPEFIKALFIMAENGKGNDKKAANELLTYVISDYKGSDWPDHDMYREKAVTVVTTHKDPEFRKGCWSFLVYYYEPENITPKLLKAYEATDDKAMRQEILENIATKTSGAFIDKNEEALNKICVPIIKDEKETTDMKFYAIKILEYSGKDKPEIVKDLEALKDSPDEKVKDAAKAALEKLGKK